MILMIAFLFMVALFVGHRHIEEYSLPMKKKILGWLLIVIAVLNLSWDIVIAIDTYNSSPIVDKELIKNRLSGYKFVPRLENLSPQKREEWERKQIIAGKIDSHTSYRNVEILYDNQIFIDMFGIDLFEQYSYDQRKAIIEDSINRYNKDYIDKIFYECLSPYTNDGKFNPKKGLGVRWEQYSILSTDEKLDLLKSYIDTSKSSFDALSPEDLISHKIMRAFGVFFLIFGWGVYTLISTPMYSPIWKRVIKTILYILMSIVLYACANSIDELATLWYLGAEFLLMIVLLILNLNQVRIERDQNKKRKPQTYNWGRLIIKTLGSLFVPILLLLCSAWLDKRDYAPWILFYLPYYLLLFIYYERLIWKNNKPFGAIFMLPLLNRIGLYQSYSNLFDFKKNLLITIMPAILISIVLPFIASLISGSRENELICHILLALPILAWIVGLVYSYSLNWLYSSEGLSNHEKK